MTALFLTIICSTSIALILKFNENRKGTAPVLLGANYFTATIISLILFLSNDIKVVSKESLIFGFMLGITFTCSFFLFALAVQVAGTALATVSARLSIIVPVLLAVIIYGELPGAIQLAGIILGLITIYFFYLSLRNNRNRRLHLKQYLILIMLLAGIGINDFCMKIFQAWRPSYEKPFFLLSIFFAAWLYSSGYVFYKKLPIERRTVVLGLILGIPNIFSSFFLLAALDAIEAIIVYPMVNIGIIIATAVAAWIIWREKLNRPAIWALTTGICAVILLGIK